MWQGSWSMSVMLGRFCHVFVMMNHCLELFLNGISHLGGEPDVGFQQIRQQFVCLVKFFFQVV